MLNKLTAIIRKDTALRFEGRSELLLSLIHISEPTRPY